MTGSTWSFPVNHQCKKSSSKQRKGSNANLGTPAEHAPKEHLDACKPPFIRALERRCKLSELLDRYTEQILYGCSSPLCKTASCRGYQSRSRKRPCRPYTHLSARTLAASLVSQDYPEKGLCPYMSRKKSNGHKSSVYLNEESVSKDKTTDHASARSFTRSAQIVEICTSKMDSGESRIVHHEVSRSAATLSPEPFKQKPRKELHDESKATDHLSSGQSHKEKDPKSFTQSLYDTASMKLLQWANIPYDLLQRSISSASGQDNAIMPNENVGSRLSASEGPPETSTDTITQDATSSNTTKTANAPTQKFNGLEMLERPHNRESSNVDHSLYGLSRELEAMLPLVFQRKSWSSDISSSTHVPPRMIDPLCLPSSASFGLVPIQPSPSLSYFTNENINCELQGLLAEVDPLSQTKLCANGIGRTDHQVPSFSCTGEHNERHDALFARFAYSTTNILSSPYALLQSFIVDQRNESMSMTVRSDSFSDMVQSFCILHDVDIHPSCIFPSLWQSVEKMYVSGVGRNKRSTFSGVIPKIQCLDDRANLNDAEASHIAKIILASLVGSLTWKSETMLIVQKLRAQGRIGIPFSSGSLTRGLMPEVFRLMDRLEDDMATDLMTRLAKALATRKYMHGSPYQTIPRDPQLQSEEAEATPDIFSLVIYNLINSIPMKAHEGPSSDAQLSLKGATFLNLSDLEYSRHDRGQHANSFHLHLVIEWLRGVIIKEWNGCAEILKCSAVGGALELMSCIYIQCSRRDFDRQALQTPFLAERLDVLEMPVSWFHSRPNRNVVHLLDYPFLFPPATLYSYFRAINHSGMCKAFETSMINTRLATKMTFLDPVPSRGEIRLQDRLETVISKYLILDIRRGDALTDAMNQLWRRQRRELMRPLKVRMGMQEGEEGVDHGGVQQEFFRVVIAEALDPKYGAFTTDPITRMTWFQPFPLEPLYKYELIGILISLAIYNGLTLPCTFPYALYMKLLNIPVQNLGHLQDGWPDLVRGLSDLRDWTDGSVEETFVRSYVFSVDVFGVTENVDLEAAKRHSRKTTTSNCADSNDVSADKVSIRDTSPLPRLMQRRHAQQVQQQWQRSDTSSTFNPIWTKHSQNEPLSTPNGLCKTLHRRSNSSRSETPMVTNANRHQYIQDYIAYLTDASIAPQFEAFARGFTTCISPRALSLFTATNLRSLVEGYSNIDTHDLQSVTSYEGDYHPHHPTIINFWNVVHGWAEQGGEEGRLKVRQLLEFVTASDRLPMMGTSRLVFVVQKNGDGDERLPTSHTCFGRLLLPEFSSAESLRKGLEKAIENSKGFGQP